MERYNLFKFIWTTQKLSTIFVVSFSTNVEEQLYFRESYMLISTYSWER